MRERLQALVALLDARDVHIYGGLLLATVGGVALSWRWALVIVGSVLVLVGLLAPLLRRE